MAGRLVYRRYSGEFKATVVKSSRVKGVMSKDIAEALDIHLSPELLFHADRGIEYAGLAFRHAD